MSILCASCFKIPEAMVNLQRKALGKRSIAKRLFRGEACRPYRLRYKSLMSWLARAMVWA
ncbi:MAG: hypothetical protein LBJ00_16695 [Planctomycetaceae bacterium]|nr:hypothetical protein [Planctomycetaceae bacterium]